MKEEFPRVWVYGYRDKTNTYDGWDLPQWDQYIRELAIFGTNAIELIPRRRAEAQAGDPHLETMTETTRSLADSGFFVTGGTLRHDASCYVERPADRQLMSGLLSGEFCYVLTSRQMGKSSLMVRTAGTLRDRGMNVVVLDLTAIGLNLSAEQWYDGLVVRMANQLRLEDELEDFWTGNDLGRIFL